MRPKPLKTTEAKDFSKSEAEMVDVMDTLQHMISIIEKEVAKSLTFLQKEIDTRNTNKATVALIMIDFNASPFRSILFHIEGQVPLADNNGPLSACFHVMCRQAAPRRPRSMHPQLNVHRRPTLWPAPSQMERRSQAARRRLRRLAVIFRLWTCEVRNPRQS